MSDDQQRTVRIVTVEFEGAMADKLDIVVRRWRDGPDQHIAQGDRIEAGDVLRVLLEQEYRRGTGGDG